MAKLSRRDQGGVERDLNSIAIAAGESSLFSRRGRILAVASCGVVAAWLALGDVQRFNHADSIIPALVSLQKWTWFYWRQNRFGMFTPLLAMPIHHPLANLLFQNWITAFYGLLFFPLAHAWLLGWRAAPLAGLIGMLIYLLAAPDALLQDYLLCSQPYAVSGCLAVLGLKCIAQTEEKGKAAQFSHGAAAALFFLACWVSIGAAILAGALAVMRALLEPIAKKTRARQCAIALMLIFIGALPNWIIAERSAFHEGYGSTPPGAWVFGFIALAGNFGRAAGPIFIGATAGAAIFGIAAWTRRADKSGFAASLRAAAVLAGAALIYGAAASVNAHVRESGYPYRYAIPCAILLVSASASLLASAADALAWKRPKAAEIALAAALLAGLALREGLPSYDRVHAALDAKFGAHTRELLEKRVTHMGGDYWKVWESAFHADLTLYENGSRRFVWGLAMRAEHTAEYWGPALASGGRVGVFRDAASEKIWQETVQNLRLPALRQVEETKDFRIYEPAVQ